jgi:uncharacterized protein YraI
MSLSPSRRTFLRTRALIALLAALLIAGHFVPFLGTAPTVRAAGAYTTDWLNLRAGPSAQNHIKLVMPPGSYVELLSSLGRSGYYKVAYQGELGYAHSDYLSVGDDDGGGGDEDPGWGDVGTAYTTDELNLRSGPSTSTRVKLVMPPGVAVTLTGAERGGFAGVIYNGTNGWASTDYLGSGGGGDPGPDEIERGLAYTTSSLNLRAGPSTSNGVKLVIPSGATVRLTGQERNGFASVRYSGTNGWASLDYLSRAPADDGDDDGSYTEREIIRIIYAAADRYGQSRSAMLAVARCESLLDPNAYNPRSAASGLFQFLPGTWATTPFANESIFDPVSNANAAAWMWSVGRRNEWVC